MQEDEGNLENQGQDGSNLENQEKDANLENQNQDTSNLEGQEESNLEDQDGSNLEGQEESNLEGQDGSNLENQVNDKVDTSSKEPKIIQIDKDAKDGQIKCPNCGSTDISLNPNTGKLRCNFCRHEFEPDTVGEDSADELRKLKGELIGSGAQKIIADTEDVLTFKCSSCGAEIVIDTQEAPQARCHWCRNTFSINQQIPNGTIPDMVLPFKLNRDQAKAQIENFVADRQFFAHPRFKKEFSTQNVMGVYLPYMVVDINAHSSLSGQGEHQTRKYYVGSGDDREARYDADLYDVKREFDILIDDLTIESSADKLNDSSEKTNNIINAIMPFDTENSAKWNANYLKGFSSEKRDVDIDQLKNKVNIQAKDVARHQANETLKQYDRGVKWASEQLNIKGQEWKAAYLPVWIYSYYEAKENLLHYVAVNARSKKTMGSVPIHMPKLYGVSGIVELFGIGLAILLWPFNHYFSWIFTFWDVTAPLADYSTGIFALSGGIYFAYYYNKYRNPDARHYHEKNTRATKENIQKSDVFVRKLTGLSNSRMNGANNTKFSNAKESNIDKLSKDITDKIGDKFIDNFMKLD